MIYKIETFVDDEGKQVVVKTPRPTLEDFAPKPEFIGTASIETNMGAIPTHFVFPEDYSLEKCFESFEKIAEQEIEKQIEAAKDQNRIITPDQARNQQS